MFNFKLNYYEIGAIPRPVEKEKKLPQRTLSFLFLAFIKDIPKLRGAKLCIDLALRTLCFLRHS